MRADSSDVHAIVGQVIEGRTDVDSDVENSRSQVASSRIEFGSLATEVRYSGAKLFGEPWNCAAGVTGSETGELRESDQVPKRRDVLVVDVGGTHVKLIASCQAEAREFESGPTLLPKQMIRKIHLISKGWSYDVVSIGYPGPVLHNRPIAEPHNLGQGWVGFDFQAAFGRPVKLINDAAMQALGSYKGGKMLFLGLGTGLGSAMIVNGIIESMELAHLPYKKHDYEYYVGEGGLKREGKRKWRRYVSDVVARLTAALEPDDVVLGGGNVKHLPELPPGCRRGENANAFLGGFRLWEDATHPVQSSIAIQGIT